MGLSIERLGWGKRQGTKGALTARGSLGDAVAVEAFEVTAAGLIARGRLDLAEDGELASARIDRLVIPGLADVAGVVQPGSNDALDVEITRGAVDLSAQLDQDDSDEDEAQDENTRDRALNIRFRLQQLLLTEGIQLSEARGQVTRGTDGALTSGLDGRLGGQVPLSIQIDRPAAGGGTLSLTSPDAGAALAAADLYTGARGGTLVLNAKFGQGNEPGLSGLARIEDIVVRSASTFRRVLSQGGLEQAEQEVTSSGIGFRKIVVPFVLADGILKLNDALATSPALALKVNGTLDEETQELDLSGVLSPAYALTGALNEIPVLGKILSGGRGEGILAVTFTLRGPAEDPDLSVNPLSILTPGFLRNVFKGGKGEADADFQARIKEPPD